MTHGFVLSRYNFCVNINDILVLELKWFSHAHPRWSLDSSFLPANPRKPSAVIILFTDNCLFSISMKPSWAAFNPHSSGWGTVRRSKTFQIPSQGSSAPPLPCQFPGVTAASRPPWWKDWGWGEKRSFQNFRKPPLCWGHIPLSHPRVTRWPLQTEVETCLPRTQSKHRSSFILLQIALTLLLCGPQSQPTTKNPPLCFKPTLPLLVDTTALLLSGSPSFHPSIHSPQNPE